MKDKKPAKTTSKEVPTDYKILQELRTMNDTLREIKELLNNIWTDKTPQ